MAKLDSSTTAHAGFAATPASGTLIRTQVAVAVLGSMDYFVNLVHNMYPRFLHRGVDGTGLGNSVTALSSGVRDETIIAGVFALDE